MKRKYGLISENIEDRRFEKVKRGPSPSNVMAESIQDIRSAPISDAQKRKLLLQTTKSVSQVVRERRKRASQMPRRG